MRFKCHAILKSGGVCGAMACDFARGVPVCGRPAHFYGRAGFAALTAESVGPAPLEAARVVIGFLSGDNTETLAREYGKARAEVEQIIRAWM